MHPTTTPSAPPPAPVAIVETELTGTPADPLPPLLDSWLAAADQLGPDTDAAPGASAE